MKTLFANFTISFIIFMFLTTECLCKNMLPNHFTLMFNQSNVGNITKPIMYYGLYDHKTNVHKFAYILNLLQHEMNNLFDLSVEIPSPHTLLL